MVLRAGAGLCTLVLLFACATAEHPARRIQAGTVPIEPARHDSAGVIILVHAADAFARAPRLAMDSVAIGRIGGAADSLLDLSGAATPVTLSDGRIAFMLGPSIRIVDPRTGRTETIGREGEGPGEFRGSDLLPASGDTLLISDQGNNRIAWVVPGRGVVRTRRAVLLGPVIWGALATFPGDTMILAPSGDFFGLDGEVGRMPNPLGRMVAGRDSIVTMLTVEGVEYVATRPVDIGGMVLETAMERYSPEARFARWGDGILAARADRWQLDRYHPDGRRTLSLRIPQARAPLTAALRQTDIDDAIARMPRDAAPALAARVRSLPYPDSLPAFAAVSVTPRGTLWLRDARIRADTTWGATAIDTGGRIIGRLEGHGRAPVAFGDDRIVFRDEDQDGLVTFRVVGVRQPN